MPERLVRPRFDVCDLSLNVPATIANEFRVSLIASAIRLIELTNERCALILSKEGAVSWAAKSRRFAPVIPRQRQLSADSGAHGWFLTGKLPDGPLNVPAAAWIDDITSLGDGQVVEHSIAVPTLNRPHSS